MSEENIYKQPLIRYVNPSRSAGKPWCDSPSPSPNPIPARPPQGEKCHLCVRYEVFTYVSGRSLSAIPTQSLSKQKHSLAFAVNFVWGPHSTARNKRTANLSKVFSPRHGCPYHCSGACLGGI